MLYHFDNIRHFVKVYMRLNALSMIAYTIAGRETEPNNMERRNHS